MSAKNVGALKPRAPVKTIDRIEQPGGATRPTPRPDPLTPAARRLQREDRKPALIGLVGLMLVYFAIWRLSQ